MGALATGKPKGPAGLLARTPDSASGVPGAPDSDSEQAEAAGTRHGAKVTVEPEPAGLRKGRYKAPGGQGTRHPGAHWQRFEVPSPSPSPMAGRWPLQLAMFSAAAGATASPHRQQSGTITTSLIDLHNHRDTNQPPLRVSTRAPALA